MVSHFYNHPQTNLLTFQFEPHFFDSSALRLQRACIRHTEVEKKDVYLMDGFFFEEEAEEMRVFSKEARFSNPVYGHLHSEGSGQKPMRGMNNKERWRFFSHPPKAIAEIYRLFSTLSLRMDAEITTMPWELCHQTTSTTAVATNCVSEVSSEDMELGIHQDYDPEQGVPFGIPVLYDKGFHPTHFVNGEVGRPLFITALLYSTAQNFLPEYGMGTVFYEKNRQIGFRSSCLHMRMVFFEGNIDHSIEKSNLPLNILSERVSYVFKLVINPKHHESMKLALSRALKNP